MKAQVEMKFLGFFEKWMSQLEEYVQLLLRKKTGPGSGSDEGNCKALVNELTQHHKDYYTAKWAGVHDDVLAFFNPVWLTPLENAYSWMTGWKPSTIFRLVAPGSTGPTHLPDLTDQQLQNIERLRVRIRMEEDKVEREMERQQVSMAERRIVELARLVGSIKNGDRPPSPQVDLMVEAAIKALQGGLETVVKMADCVRLKTLKGILDVLSPVQSLDFLAASAMLLIEMRKLGKRREDLHGINETERNYHGVQ